MKRWHSTTVPKLNWFCSWIKRLKWSVLNKLSIPNSYLPGEDAYSHLHASQYSIIEWKEQYECTFCQMLLQPVHWFYAANTDTGNCCRRRYFHSLRKVAAKQKTATQHSNTWPTLWCIVSTRPWFFVSNRHIYGHRWATVLRPLRTCHSLRLDCAVVSSASS